MKKVSKAKPGNNIVSPAKPMPSVTEPLKGSELPFFNGPGLNVPKQPKDYSKNKGK